MASNFGSFNRSPFGAFIKSPLGARGGVILGKWFYQNTSFYLCKSDDGLIYTQPTILDGLTFGPVDIVDDNVIIGPAGKLVFPYENSDFSSATGSGSIGGKIIKIGNRYTARASTTLSSNGIYYSDDLATWSVGGTFPNSPVSGYSPQFLNSNLCEKNGTLYLIIYADPSGSPPLRSWMVYSNDGGQTWANTGYEASATNSTNGDIILFVRSNGDLTFTRAQNSPFNNVYTSSDNGATFTGSPIHSFGPPNRFGQRSTVTSAQGSFVYKAQNGDVFAFSPKFAPITDLYVIRNDGYSASDYEIHTGKGVGCYAGGKIYYVDSSNFLHRMNSDCTNDITLTTTPSTLQLSSTSARLVVVGMED